MAGPAAPAAAGDWPAAAARWRDLGCDYEAALALAADRDDAAARGALDELLELGAQPAAAIVARRLRERGARGLPAARAPARAPTRPA